MRRSNVYDLEFYTCISLGLSYKGLKLYAINILMKFVISLTLTNTTVLKLEV